jgi:hypothetical protein
MAITNFQDITIKEATGKIVHMMLQTPTTATITAPAAASGALAFTVGGGFQSLGTTLPSTLVDAYPAGLTSNPLRAMWIHTAATRAETMLLGRIYKIGTINWTATGQRLTHDAATFPILRTAMGTSQKVPLIPFIYMTAATTTTAAIFTMKYVNQDNTTVTGTRTFTMPNIATAIQSCFFMNFQDIGAVNGRMDTAVYDITEINVTTSAAVGTSDLWGLEILGVCGSPSTSNTGSKNFVYQGITIPNINPGAATSGTAVTKLAVLGVGTASTLQITHDLKAFVDD